jgi:hypothetical protein
MKLLKFARAHHFILGLLISIALGCAKEAGDRVKTTPVTGEVFVDGKPAGELRITVTSVKGIDPTHPTTSSAVTDENGKFAVSTYEANDGVPAGEYILTFNWGTLNRLSMSYENDKLKGNYDKPDKSTIRVTVEEGKPVDMGKIELKTK